MFIQDVCFIYLPIAEIDVASWHIVGSPMAIGIIPSSASVSTAIIRNNIQAGSIYQFDIMTSDRFGNLLSSVFYSLYGARQFLVQMQYTGPSQLNSSTGNVYDRKGKFFILLAI